MNLNSNLKTGKLQEVLLQREFDEQTNWCVITGAPCSGKTSVLEWLRRQGFNCKNEIARIYIEREFRKGHSLEQIRGDEATFQRGLIDAKLIVEMETSPNQVTFFDRAIPDSITYYRVAGLNPNDVLPVCFHFRYGAVFIFDRLTLKQDGARIEDDRTADFIDYWLEKDYSALKYKVVRVPVMDVEERASFVLNKLKHGDARLSLKS